MIIAIYNEEKYLEKVLSSVVNSNLITEVICVNDGSTDNSLEILKSFKEKIILIDLKKNQGKGNAMAVGIQKAKNEVLLFIDADLKNLQESHIKALLHPIISQQAQVSIGFYTRSIEDIVFSFFLSGERVYFKKDLVPLLELMKESKFGVEILLNHHLKKLQHKRVFLSGLKVTSKQEKHGFFLGTQEFMVQIGEVISQFIKIKFKKAI